MNRTRVITIGLATFTLAAAVLTSGCVTNRGVLNVQVKAPPNPASGKMIRIVRVTDKRKFEVRPTNPSTPSLRGGHIEDKATTIRAVARKRNGYGKALGDIVLPEGRTVEHVVTEALTKAFREAGYRVADANTPATPDTISVEADIEEFWSWFKPGFWAVALQFKASVKVKGDVPPFQDGQTVKGYVKLRTQGASGRAWMNTFNKGLDTLVQDTKKKLSAK